MRFGFFLLPIAIVILAPVPAAADEPLAKLPPEPPPSNQIEGGRALVGVGFFALSGGAILGGIAFANTCSGPTCNDLAAKAGAGIAIGVGGIVAMGAGSYLLRKGAAPSRTSTLDLHLGPTGALVSGAF